MHTPKSKQGGMTFTSVLMLAAVFAFIVMVGLKIIPSYIEHYSIKKVLLSLENEPMITKKSQAEIRKLIKKRFKINSVYDFDPKNIIFSKKPNGLEVRVTYEVREKVIGNLDVVMSFDDAVLL